MKIETYSFTHTELELHMTDVKNLLVGFLHNKGLINDETAANVRNNYAVLLRKPSFFRQLLGLRKKHDEPEVIIVKQETLIEPKEAEPPVKLVEDKKDP